MEYTDFWWHWIFPLHYDSAIRILHEKDRQQFLILTTVPADDSEFAKSIANNLSDCFSNMKYDPKIAK